MDLGASTHPGFVRAGNEDGFFASGEHAVFAVADGMGGHEFGEVASHLALETIAQQAEALAHADPAELPTLLYNVVQDANRAIFSQAAAQDARSRMGTTLIVAVIHGDRLYFAHIGDSRLYLLRGEAFSQLTRDHSLVQTMVDRGEITAEEAAIHPLRHQITRVVGGDDHVSPEIASQALEPGDQLLLCTDGLSGVVAAEELKATLGSRQSAQARVETLVQAALAGGGPDNVTAIVIDYAQPLPTKAAAPQPSRHGYLPFWQSSLIALLVLAVLAAAAGLWSFTHPRYFIATDTEGRLAIYQRWAMLPMLHPRLVRGTADAADLVIEAREAAPYLKQFGDVRVGIPVADEDTGLAFLHDVEQKIAGGLLAEVKDALDAGDTAKARESLQRARTVHADDAMVRQLETMIRQAEDAGASSAHR